MGILLLPLVLVSSILLSVVGDYWVRQFLAAGFHWKITALCSVLLTIPVALALFGAMPMLIELDPLDGWMTGWEIVQFAVAWSAYSSVFWAVMIVLGTRARSKSEGR